MNTIFLKKAFLVAVIAAFSIPCILRANRADIYPTGRVDMADFAVLAAAWLSDNSPTPNWNPDCDISDPNDGFVDELDLAVLAANWLWTAIDDMVWVDINDPGVSGNEPFNGEMSKYETTNAQYCQFLNVALASGDITVGPDNMVYGANGSNSGADFVGEQYFETSDYDSEINHSQITYSGGVFSVLSRDGYSMSNHPVLEVSWYGATAFCNYYGYQLPTQWQWQAVADYDGSYTYGCGTTIDQGKANYYLGSGNFCNPLGLSGYPYTSPVNHYSSYGYGINDMAGNACEWTSTVFSSYRIIRGGSWGSYDTYCTVSSWSYCAPSDTLGDVGFRVCR